MGTNYYVKTNVCPTCGREDEDLHIGKSSAGWYFSLHIIPEDGINNLNDWKKVWSGKQIYNEYGKYLTEDEMLKIITQRKWKEQWHEKPLGYDSWEEFHQKNHSERGLNGLLRHRIGNHCVGHGEGTWDYITGEFS